VAIRIGVDIGGTFTDLVLVDTGSGSVAVEKLSTTPEAPEAAVLEGIGLLLRRLGLGVESVDNLTHGTTLVANALIERKGAHTALLTTDGFRDALEIGREGRYDLNDLGIELPRPLIPRRLRFDVGERMLADGTTYRPLDLGSLDEAIALLGREAVESVAICFLHSYANDAHETAAATRVAAALPGVFLSVSAEVSPEIREYERTSTAAANAYVGPVVARYLARLLEGLRARGLSAPLFVMLSSGGLATTEVATRFPIRMLESGPAAGAILATYLGGREDVRDMLSFDMGGTTAKACLIERGRPRTTAQVEVARVWRFKKGSGLPITVPVVDMIEIGAGGGSIARIGHLGAIEVGPESAGADPGPACYGRGGTLPTVTDADLVLGYLEPGYFLGGAMTLDVGLAREALRTVADPLGLHVETAAWWIHRVVAENMASAARVHAAERAVDLRALPLFAFGGAGPVHAVSVARLLNSASVIVPNSAGVGSAVGFLVAPVGFELSRSRPSALSALDLDEVRQAVEEMERQVRELVVSAGVRPADVQVEYRVAARHVGQGFELEVDLPAPAQWTRALIEDRFRTRYASLRGIVVQGVAVEVATWRVAASADLHPLESYAGAPESAPALKGERRIFRQDLETMAPAPVYDRYRLAPGWCSQGPLVIEERECTLVVPLAAEVRVTPGGSIVVAGF
jgi:N-methylhydantoinase A